MNRTESSHRVTNVPVHVIESFRNYNRSQINKLQCIDDSFDDVGGAHDVPQPKSKTLEKLPIYTEWVQTLMDYNEKFIGIIDKMQSSNIKGTNECLVQCNLIDIDDYREQNKQSEISIQHKLIAENQDLREKIKYLEQQNEGLEEAAVEARVLVFEVAERHDMIVKQKNEINDMEQQLKQKDTHIQFKDEIIKELRQQRRGYLKCPHNLGKTKLDSIDKVVDLIRTVRDISPDSKGCDCYNDFYQEKENQTDEELCKSFQLKREFANKIETQQAEIQRLNVELEKKQLNYERISKMFSALQQQLDSLQSNTENVQVGKSVKSDGTVAEYTTAIADKTHLANLITSLKSELASANALLKVKQKDCNDNNELQKRYKGELFDANIRVGSMEKQCEHYRQTIKHLEDLMNTHSDTIKRLEEQQSILKSQMTESQEKQQNYQKLVDENRKLDSNMNLLAHSSSPATASTCSNNLNSISTNCSYQHYRECSLDILGDNLQTSFLENMKLNRTVKMLRDENIDLRERIVDVETDYVTLNDSYRHFLTITTQYENDLLEELAYKSFEYDEDCLSNGAPDRAVVNGIQEKLLRMESDCAKRLKIQENCYKKKLNQLNNQIMDLNRQMQTRSPVVTEDLNRISEDEKPRSTLKELVSQIHHLQQNIREKEMLIKRTEISSNFKTDSLSQQIARLEKQIEQEKRLNANLSAELESNRRESMRMKETNVTTNKDQIKQMNELKRLNEEHVDRVEKQNDDVQRLNTKLTDATLINTQLNDELNEKTEQICQLHSENSRLTIEMTKLVTEMKNGQDNESHLSVQLATERKATDSTSKSLSKCEALLKKFTDKNELLCRESTTLADNVVELKEHLKESQKREDVLSQDLRSLTDLLKEAQHNLRLSNEKVHHLSVYQHKFVELKKAHEQMLQEIAEKAANIKKTEANLTKLQNSYDLLLGDYNHLQDIRVKAEHTLKTTNEWKQEQQHRDELINKKITMQSEHISTLLEDRNALIAKNHEMLRDMLILKQKLEDFKCALPNIHPAERSSFSLTSPILRYCSDPQINDFEEYQQRLDYNVKRMTKNLQRTRAFWEKGISYAIKTTVTDNTIEDDSIENSPRDEDA